MPKTVKIDVDLDKKCSECGKKGACQNGLCMECSGDKIIGAIDNMIGIQKCVFGGLQDVVEFLRSQALPLRDAYLNMEDCLTVSIKIQVGPAKEAGQYRVKSGVAFVTDQVKFKTGKTMAPNQRELGLV